MARPHFRSQRSAKETLKYNLYKNIVRLLRTSFFLFAFLSGSIYILIICAVDRGVQKELQEKQKKKEQQDKLDREKKMRQERERKEREERERRERQERQEKEQRERKVREEREKEEQERREKEKKATAAVTAQRTPPSTQRAVVSGGSSAAPPPSTNNSSNYHPTFGYPYRRLVPNTHGRSTLTHLTNQNKSAYVDIWVSIFIPDNAPVKGCYTNGGTYVGNVLDGSATPEIIIQSQYMMAKVTVQFEAIEFNYMNMNYFETGKRFFLMGLGREPLRFPFLFFLSSLLLYRLQVQHCQQVSDGDDRAL